jgi:hypothetical protein
MGAHKSPAMAEAIKLIAAGASVIDAAAAAGVNQRSVYASAEYKQMIAAGKIEKRKYIKTTQSAA